jgi:hypothetical protein
VTAPSAWARVVGSLLAPRTVDCVSCGVPRGVDCPGGVGFCPARKAAVAHLSTAERVDAYELLRFELEQQRAANRRLAGVAS